MDAAHKWTDEELEKIERKIGRIYSQAEKEMRQKQSEFMKDYAEELEAREKALDKTKEAQENHKKWLEEKSREMRRINDMVNELARRATSANKEALKIVEDSIPGICAENANYGAYQVDKAIGHDTSFTLVDENTVRQLVLGEEDLVPKIDGRKDLRWNRQHFKSAITQGILQGEPVDKIGDRLRSVIRMNRNSALRAARTATTAAENAGRVSSYKRAKDIGIDIMQEWLATFDGRTRKSHRELDGQKADVGGYFVVPSNGHRIRFPGDPMAHPSEVYNCRCTLVPAIAGHDQTSSKRWGRFSTLGIHGDVGYEEWKRMLSSAQEGSRNLFEDYDIMSNVPIDEYLDEADEVFRTVINEHFEGFVLRSATSEKAYYTHGDGIYMDLTKIKTDKTDTMGTLFHEIGHNLDHNEGWISTSNDGANLREAIIEDYKNMLDMVGGAPDQIEGAVRSLLGQGDVDKAASILRIRGAFSPTAKDFSENAIVEALEKHLHSASDRSPVFSLANSINGNWGELSHQARLIISDILEGASYLYGEEFLVVKWGHGYRYWEQRSDGVVEQEAFANMVSADALGGIEPSVLEEIKEWLPRTYEAYRQKIYYLE